MESATQPDPAIWECVTTTSGGKAYRCQICNDFRPREAHRLADHERRSIHLTALQHREQSTPSVNPANISNLPLSAFVADGTRALLASLAAPAGSFGETSMADYPEPLPPQLPPPRLLDWGLSENTELDSSPEARAVAQIAEQLSQYFDMDPTSDDEPEERSDEEGDEDELPEPTVTVDNGDEEEILHGEKRARTRDHTQYSRQWYPWTDKITCTLDVLMHLPRSVFSHRQLELFLWLLKVNNVDDVPSVKSMQELNAMLQKLCGIETIAYDGALGNKYYVNSLGQIIAQEMSNPKVRPHLEFYPEDTGKLIEEARQGKRWLEEIPSAQTTPMARIGMQDYFIHEPAMLTNGKFCMPIRWFARGKILFAKCWDLAVVTTEKGQNWRVIQHVQDPISGTLSDWDLTDPTVGNPWRERAKGARVLSFPIWLYCDDTSGNLSKKWNEHNSFLFTPAGLPREQSQKEYNIHFLCTSNVAPPLEMLDGILDQLETAQKDGIWAWDCELNELVLLIPTVLALLGDNPMQRSDSLDDDDATVSHQKKPSANANASDSESQMGTDTETEGGSNMGVALGDEPQMTGDAGPAPSDAGSAPSSNIPQAATDPETTTDGSKTHPVNAGETISRGQPTEEGQKPKSRGKRAKETLDEMRVRVKAFIKIGKRRTKEETTAKLRSYFDNATTLNTKTKVKNMRTASGIKDTFQLVFLEKLFNSYKNKRGTAARQAALDAQRQKLPKNTTSPVWRIEGLDPHQDTPVEILHVVLLGFVKYLWRDLVQNQLHSKPEQKSLLETRLNSFDVSGLGISPLAGHTLVQYSGSLTGRDFRAIAQAAPYVVYDLVSRDCLATWVALSKLIPLIWQPSIKDIDAHVALLTAEINHFLACAARWTTRWFNKPKFHILLHLPEHVRRFGPAILFATEAFESFNAVIRAKSVHSNRHAPSRDIARAFAQGNRIRHLLSGGLFMQPSLVAVAPKPTTKGTQFTTSSTTTPAQAPSDNPSKETPAAQTFTAPAPTNSSTPSTALPRLQFIANRDLSREKKDWTHAGPGPLSLVSSSNTVTQYLGMDGKKRGTHGLCVSDKRPPQLFSATLTGSKLPNSFSQHSAQPSLLKTNSAMYLENGDLCELEGFVIVKRPNQATFIARVKEILQIKGSADDLSQRPSAILLQTAAIGAIPDPSYGMPAVGVQGQWSLVPMKDILCTVNVQHNCAMHECGPTGFRYVYQEREATQQTRPMITHVGPKDDLLLNTCQMRDAVNLQPFRINSPVFDSEAMEGIVTASILREAQQKKAAAAAAQQKQQAATPSAEAPAVRGRGRGGGRGRGQGRGRGVLPATQRLAELQGQATSSSQLNFHIQDPSVFSRVP
ncbi:hypothetical protein MVEN_02374000 [Mycena venus]|uniref:C2H2-type domain-containing protein n=1 Tax=Mycena venus TaxID=2733690 RepID=A0A8H6X2K3_9AGAR|nr:hypothetical protein MVEN_02374000 [Mycena venus]